MSVIAVALDVPSERPGTAKHKEILFGKCHGQAEPIFWKLRAKFRLVSWLELPGGTSQLQTQRLVP